MMAVDNSEPGDVKVAKFIKRGKSRKRGRVNRDSDEPAEDVDETAVGTVSVRDRERVRDAARKLDDGGAEVNSGRYNASESAVAAGIEDQGATAVNLEAEGGAEAPSKGSYGPKRAPSNIRSSVRFDYQPDVCKDYKETGFCGFGDACIFLHDRSNYKSGWQLEKEWDEKESARKKVLGKQREGDGAKGEDDASTAHGGSGKELPFACYICRKEFSRPVVTLCDHYFDEKCALDRFATDPTCAVCKKDTRGVFNVAKRLVNQRPKSVTTGANTSLPVG